MDVEVKIAKASDWNKAIVLAGQTFCMCNYKGCTSEGSKHFLDGLENKQLYQVFLQGKYPLFCAYLGERMVGMITIRNDNHISLFFVEKAVQKQGVGQALLRRGIEHCFKRGQRTITVNASRVAVSFYQKHGFYIVAEEYLDNGVYITEMQYKVPIYEN